MEVLFLEESFIERIPFFQGNVQISEIKKGYSTDRKYVVEKDQQQFVLRTFDYKHYSSKQAEFDALVKMKELDVKCSRPIEFGSLAEDGIGYMILTYIEGTDASEELPKCSQHIQYQIGLESGSELRKIHQYAAPNHVSPWYDRKVSKHKRYIEEYFNTDVRIQDDEKIISYIDDHLHLMKHRPNIFQHDDFHVGNLIVKDQALSGVIDFNRFDWGDPVHEFLKVGFFSSEISIPFSIGQIKGYHRNEEPDALFWKLYSLYIAMCVISSVVWIQKVKPEETDIMLNKIDRVLEDHHYFELTKPKWYVNE